MSKSKTTKRLELEVNAEVDAAEERKLTNADRPDGLVSGAALRERDGSLRGIATPAGRIQAEVAAIDQEGVFKYFRSLPPDLPVEDAYKQAIESAVEIVDEYVKRCKHGDTLRHDAVMEMRRRIAGL